MGTLKTMSEEKPECKLVFLTVGIIIILSFMEI